MKNKWLIVLALVGFTFFVALCLMGIMGGEEKEIQYKSRD